MDGPRGAHHVPGAGAGDADGGAGGAGFVAVSGRMPEETGFYRPLVLARAPWRGAANPAALRDRPARSKIQRPDLPAPCLIFVAVLIALARGAAVREGPEAGPAVAMTRAQGEPAEALPGTAAPSSGAPGPVRASAKDPAIGFGLLSPLVARRGPEDDDVSFDTVAAIPETRTPTTPAQHRRMLLGSRKKPRNPNHRFLPLPHLSAQPATGVTLGGSLTYSYRRRGEVFNRIYLLVWSRISTRLVQDHILQGRVRDMLGRREVFQFGAIAQTDPVFPFHGVNNHQNKVGTDINGPEHWVNVNNYAGWLTYEHPIWQLQRPGRAVGNLRVYSGILYNVDVVKAYKNTQFEREFSEAAGTVRRGVVRGGLTWDSRDNDWSPREGSLTDVIFDAVGKYTGSTQGYGRVHATTRHYWSLGDSDLVLANRFTFDGLWGSVPLMPLGELGGLFPIDGYGGAFIGRGFTRKRFIGNFKASAAFELRHMPVELKFGRHTLGVGWEGFFEMGLVSQKIIDLFKYWHPSGGTGLLLIWDRFVVLRVEIGGSREGAELYVQSEHAF